ncbi:MAG: DUF1552 domain-containing protein [Pseudomonadota bacterium]
MSARGFGRRDLFRAAGAMLAVPAFLRRAFAAESELGPRLVIMMQAVGTHQQTFWPDPATGTSPILHPILSQAALAKKTVVVKGVINQAKGFGNEHDRGFHSLWTGVAPVGSPEDSFGGGPSIDQMLKQQLKPTVLFPTLNCGVLAAEVGPKNGHRRSFSYFGPKQQVTTIVDPYRLYATLFRDQQAAADPPAAARRLMLRQSVLDHAARDLTDLAGRLGPNERRKLDAHTTALREYENRLAASATSGASTCARPGAPTPGLNVMLEDNLPIVFLGRAGGRLTRTGVVAQGEQSHHRLGTSVMQLMGAPVNGFGDQPNAGPLLGLA